jgi:hypothetical protein
MQKKEQELRCAWTLWNRLAQLEDILWKRYGDEFMKLELDQEFKSYLSQPQDDDMAL